MKDPAITSGVEWKMIQTEVFKDDLKLDFSIIMAVTKLFSCVYEIHKLKGRNLRWGYKMLQQWVTKEACKLQVSTHLFYYTAIFIVTVYDTYFNYDHRFIIKCKNIRKTHASPL